MGACIYGSFCNHDLKHFSILRVSANALYDCYSKIVGQFFFPVKGYCVNMTNKIIHGCLHVDTVWNFSSRVQLDILLVRCAHS